MDPNGRVLPQPVTDPRVRHRADPTETARVGADPVALGGVANRP